MEFYPTNLKIHIYEAGDNDRHVFVFVDTDGIEVDEDDVLDFAKADLGNVEDELGREITKAAREELLDSLEDYYEWKARG